MPEPTIYEKPVKELFGPMSLKDIKYMYGAVDTTEYEDKHVLAYAKQQIQLMDHPMLVAHFDKKTFDHGQMIKYLKSKPLQAYKRWLKKVVKSTVLKPHLKKSPGILPYLYVGFISRFLEPLDVRKTVQRLAKTKAKKGTAQIVKDSTPYDVVDTGKGKPPAPVGSVNISTQQGNVRVKYKSETDWVYLGILGAKKGKNKGKPEKFLKDVGFDLDKIKANYKFDGGGVTLLAPKKPEFELAKDEKPSKDDIDKATAAVYDTTPSAQPIPFPSVADQVKFTKATQRAAEFLKKTDEFIAMPTAINNIIPKLKKEYSDLLGAIADDKSVHGARSFIKELVPHVTKGGYLGISVDNWHKAKGSLKPEKMADLYGPDWAGLAYGIAASLQKDLGGEGDTTSYEKMAQADDGDKWIKLKDVSAQPVEVEPEPESPYEKLANAAVSFYNEVGEFTNSGDFNKSLSDVAKNYSSLSPLVDQLGSIGSVYWMVHDLNKETKIGGSTHTIVTSWQGGAAPGPDEMEDLYGKDWYALGSAIVDALKVPNTAVSAPAPTPAPASAPEEKPKYTVIPTGKGKGAVPVGAFKVFMDKKGKIQVRRNIGKGKWAQIGTVGAKKGKNKGKAEAFLAKHGVDLADFDLSNGGVTIMPADNGDALATSAAPDSMAAKVEIPVVSQEVKDAMFGFKEMYDLVISLGGIASLDKVISETLTGADPDWEAKFLIGKLVDSKGIEAVLQPENEKAIKAVLATKEEDKWAEYAAEAHNQLKAPAGVGNPPAGQPTVLGKEAEAEAPKKADLPKATPAKPKLDPKPEPKYGLGYIPPAPNTVAADLPIPPPDGLTKKKSGSSLGGAGQKDIYVDSQGNEFLFKLATSKGSGQVEEFRAHVQAGFSEIAREIKPIHPRIEVTKLGGTVGAIYPFLPGADKVDLSGESPSSLSDQEKLDVAEEHLLDWVMSQHDSHSKNFLRTAEGRIVGIDKEQGFKYMEEDKLDIDYHPNSAYGEEEPFYNKFWREYAEGKNDFDPTKLSASVDKLMRMDGLKFSNALGGYAKAMFPDSKVKQDAFIRKVLNRKNTIKIEFERFVTDLTKKREGKEGTFKFSTGWVEEGKEEFKTINHPPKIKRADDFLSELTGTSKTQEHQTDKSLITVKSSKSSDPKVKEDQLVALMKKMGLEIKEGPLTGGVYAMVMVDKEAWEAIQEETPGYTETIKIEKSTAIPPAPEFPEYMPIVSPKKETGYNLDQVLESVDKGDNTGYGLGITFDGSLVEQQRGRVTRRKDLSGQEYVEVSFKLREGAAKNAKGGETGTFYFNGGEMKDGVLTDTGNHADIAKAKIWTEGDDKAYVISDEKKFSYNNFVILRIYSKPVKAAVAKLMGKVKKAIPGELLKAPTEEEKLVASYSSALKAVSPQEADDLDLKEKQGTYTRTSADLLERLQDHLSDEQISSIAQVENGASAVQVIPGRWRTINSDDPSKPRALFGYWNTYVVENIVAKFKTVGAASIVERNLIGVTVPKDKYSSYDSDVKSGCADNMTTRLATMAKANEGFNTNYGNLSVVFAPDELDRLDPILYDDDKFGCVNPAYPHKEYADAFRDRVPIEKMVETKGYRAELVIRRVIPSTKIVRVATENSSLRENVIKAFREAGLTTLNGVPVEDFVVLRQKILTFYEKYIKPAGY